MEAAPGSPLETVAVADGCSESGWVASPAGLGFGSAATARAPAFGSGKCVEGLNATGLLDGRPERVDWPSGGADLPGCAAAGVGTMRAKRRSRS